MLPVVRQGLCRLPLELLPLVPLPYQEADIEKFVNHEGTGLLVAQVGGRKTLVAIEVALRMGFGTKMIVAPASTHTRGWTRTIQRQSPEVIVRRLDSSKTGKAALDDMTWGVSGWYICTPQWFARQDWRGIEPDWACFDEIHVAGAHGNVTREKLHQLKASARMGLSGTPLRNKEENAWGIVRWLYPKLFPRSFWAFVDEYLETVYDHFAPRQKRISGEKSPGRIVSILPCYIQHLQREQCCEFHPNGFLDGAEKPEEITRIVQMVPEQKRAYRDMEAHYLAYLKGNPMVASMPAVAWGRLRQIALGVPTVDTEGVVSFDVDCVSPKITDLLDVLSDMGTESAVVFTHSQKIIPAIVHRLAAVGISALEWSGAVKQSVRDVALEDFISGEVRVIVAQIDAAGTGTDGLQEACSTEIWLSESSDGTANVQGRGRLDRPGQRNRVVRIRIQAEGTADQGIVSKQIEEQLRINMSLRAETR